MSDKIIEAVARAIAAHTYDDAAEEWGPEDMRPKDEYIEACWRVRIPIARAAILARLEALVAEPEIGVGDLQAQIKAMIDTLKSELEAPCDT